MVKRLLLIISSVIFVASLVGVYSAFTLPREKEETSTLLNYEHTGSFDYLVYLKPSYLFGPEPQEPPPPPPAPPPLSNLQYPIEFIDSFDFTFGYRFVPDRPVAATYEEVEVRAIVKNPNVEAEPRPPPNLQYPTEIIDRFNLTFSYRFVPDRPVAATYEEVEVRAIVKRPGVNEEEITLVPRTTKTGDFTISFPLDISDKLSGGDITINAYVYTTVETDTGPIFKDFTQSLPMRSGGRLVEVEGPLDRTESGYVEELNYEQHGKFNYEVLLKSGSPFGPITLKPRSVAPPAPLPPKTKVAGGTEEIILVPRTTKTGDFTISFPLDISDKLSGGDITINAYVYTTVETDTGPIFKDFTQSLTLKVQGPLFEVSRNLEQSQVGNSGALVYEQKGRLDYTVRLKPDSPFGAIALVPPSQAVPLSLANTPPQEEPSKTVKPGEVVFVKLINKIDASFEYRFVPTKPVRELSQEVTITAIVEGKGWSKSVVLVPATKKSGNFRIDFPIDLGGLAKIIEAIQKETGVPGDKLTIKANVHVAGRTDYGLIDEVYSQTLSTVLGKGTLEWAEKLMQSKSGAINITKVIPNPDKYLGLSVNDVRIVSAIVAGIIFLLWAYLVWLNVKFRRAEVCEIEKEISLNKKKYGERIAEAKSQTPIEGEKVISLSSIEDLIKIADELGKPVIYQAAVSTTEQPHAYYVFDGLTRYEYLLVER